MTDRRKFCATSCGSWLPPARGSFTSFTAEAHFLYPIRDHNAYSHLCCAYAVRKENRRRGSATELTRHGYSVIRTTMPTGNIHKTMTELLREALTEADSIRAVARENGLDHSSLVRFANSEQSLRLDLADKLAAHFGIVSTRRKAR